MDTNDIAILRCIMPHEVNTVSPDGYYVSADTERRLMTLSTRTSRGFGPVRTRPIEIPSEIATAWQEWACAARAKRIAAARGSWGAGRSGRGELVNERVADSTAKSAARAAQAIAAYLLAKYPDEIVDTGVMWTAAAQGYVRTNRRLSELLV